MFGKLFVVAALVACVFAAPKPSVVQTETIAAAPAIATYAAAPAIATTYAAAPVYSAGYNSGFGLGAGLAQTYHAAPLVYHTGYGYGSYY